MCTAATYLTKDFYFGRNLDLHISYGERVTITPRNYPFHFREVQSLEQHYAIIGMALIMDDYPLYFDATNEIGDRVKLTLAVEIMAQHSNVILFNEENRIVDALRRVDSEKSSYRLVLPGAQYKLPPP